METVEPVPVEDDLCTSLYTIEDLGFGARFVLVHRQTCYETGAPVLVVKRKIVMPYDSIVHSLETTADFAVRRGLKRAAQVLRLVR
ncbi:MAG: hypothetical protein HXY30_15995 [Pseudorhodoplanes sp.]|nr:hypothetical protein [Pseudorhodoplanes sp.]